MRTLFFDTEFNGTSEPQVNPVCGVVEVEGETHSYWFADGIDAERFKEDWAKWSEEDRVIVCYAAEAETRCLLGLGFTAQELMSRKWLDLHVLARMLRTEPTFRYGKYYDKKTGEMEESVPPPSNYKAPEFPQESPDCYKETGTGLADLLLHQLDVEIDRTNKDQMRDLILNSKTFTVEQQSQILAYCTSDVQYLRPLGNKLVKAIRRFSSKTTSVEDLIRLSQYTVDMGIVESYGIPMEMEKARNISANHLPLRDEIINSCNKVFPFYAREKATKADRLKSPELGPYKWVKKDTVFQSFVKKSPYVAGWPKTEKGALKSDKTTLKDYSADSVLNALFVSESSLSSIDFFSHERIKKMENHLGSDGRLRLYLAPYCSRTSRNQPGVAQGFVLGMPVWTRSLIGSEDCVVIGGDYSGQEIALQALASGDPNLLEAYKSGDPYFWLAKLTGTVSEDIIQDRPKHYSYSDGRDLPPDEQKKLKGIRNTFKALFLGLGYGLGSEKLASRLTAAKINSLTPSEKKVLQDVQAGLKSDQDPEYVRLMESVTIYDKNHETDAMPDEIKASTYSNYHRNTFARYWEWREETKNCYRLGGHLRLPDGWCLFGKEKDLTAMNFPVQGLGAVILRSAVRKSLMAGLTVCAPHHDALYITSTKERATQDGETLERCMRDAVIEICGSDLIGVDLTEESTDWQNLTSTWSDERQPAEFKAYGQYMIKANPTQEK